MPQLFGELLQNATSLIGGSDRLAGRYLTEQRLRQIESCILLLEGKRTDGRSYGFYHKAALQEAMSSTDFPSILGDALSHQLLPMFQALPPVLWPLGRQGSFADFSEVKRDSFQGGQGILTEVKERGVYEQNTLSEAQYTYTPVKKGSMFDLSWELLLSDQRRLDALRSLPQRMANAAFQTRERFAADMLVTTTGWRTTLAAAMTGAAISTEAFTASSLGAALAEMLNYNMPGEASNMPMLVEPKYLLYSPSLEFTVREVLQSPNILITGSTNSVRGNINVVAGSLIPVKVPWFHRLVTAAPRSTMWGLMSDANALPGFEVGTLEGHSTPELFVSTSGSRMLGGGEASSETFGSFENDTTRYKVRDVHGGVFIFPQAFWVSNGQ